MIPADWTRVTVAPDPFLTGPPVDGRDGPAVRRLVLAGLPPEVAAEYDVDGGGDAA